MVVIVVVVVMVPNLVMENVKCVGDDENVRMNVLGMVRIDNDHDVDKENGGFVIIFVDVNSLIIIFIMVVIFLKITYTVIYVSSSLSHLLLLS